MDKLQVFKSGRFSDVRATLIDDEPWFVGSDIAKALDYDLPSKAVRDHVDSEDIMKSVEMAKTSNEMLFINESGVYSMIFNSKQERAKEFKHWVTHEVLPSIRKTGSYGPSAKQIPLENAVKIAGMLNGMSNVALETALQIIDLTGYEMDAFILPENARKSKKHCGRYPSDQELVKILKELYHLNISAFLEIAKQTGISLDMIFDTMENKINLHPTLAELLRNTSQEYLDKVKEEKRLYFERLGIASQPVEKTQEDTTNPFEN